MDLETKEFIEGLLKDHYGRIPSDPEEYFTDEVYGTFHTKMVVDEIMNALDIYDDGRGYEEEEL